MDGGGGVNQLSPVLKSIIPDLIDTSAPISGLNTTLTPYFTMGDQDTSLLISSNFSQSNNNLSFLNQLFLVDINGDTQLTNFTDSNNEIKITDTTRIKPKISGDGSTVVWYYDGDPLGTNTDRGFEIFSLSTATKTLRQLTDNIIINNIWPTITTDGSLVAFASSSDLVAGSNTQLITQIFTVTTDGNNTVTQVTSFNTRVLNTGINKYFDKKTRSMSISGDGNTIAFISNDDVLTDGSNADRSDEIFTINTDGTNLKQQTNLNSTTELSTLLISHTGSILCFVDNTGSPFNASKAIYTIDTTNQTLLQIVPNWLEGGAINGPLYSRDYLDLSGNGTTIAYVNSSVNGTLIVINADGSNSRDITPTLINENDTIDFIAYPELSFDGSTTTFFSSIRYTVDPTAPFRTSLRQIYTISN